MNLTLNPEITQWPVSHYVFIEKIGPFQDTARQAWEELHKNLTQITNQVKEIGYTSLYKVEPEMLYRAGVMVDAKPAGKVAGFQYEKFNGGKYSRFVLTGSYNNLPEAVGKVFDVVEKTKIAVADNFFLENYVNNPATTPEDQLITEILIPTK